MNVEKSIGEHKLEEGEEILWQEGLIYLTNKALYWNSSILKRTALGNVKNISYDNVDGAYVLDIVSTVKDGNQVERLQGMEDAAKVRKLIDEAIAKVPKEEQLEVSQQIVLNDVELVIPRSESSNDKELKNKLEKALGEDQVDWLWVHCKEEDKTATRQHYFFLGISGLLYSGFVLNALYTGDYLSAFMLLLLIGILLKISLHKKYTYPYATFGVTSDRVVALSNNGKKVEQIAISSIQTNNLEKARNSLGGVSNEFYLNIETSRKKIKIPNLKFDKEVQEMIEDLKKNSDQLRLD